MTDASSTDSRAGAITNWTIVAVALTAGTIGGINFGKAPPALPDLRVELALTLVAAGWVTSIFNAVAAGVGTLSGGVVDRFGARGTLAFGLGAMALGSLVGSVAESGSLLIVARFLEGIGFVVTIVAGPTLMVAVTVSRHLRLAMTLWGTYMPLGMSLVTLLSPLALQGVGWRGLWHATTALCLLCLVLVLIATRDRRHAPPLNRRLTLDGLRQSFASPGAWLLTACFATYTFQWAVLTSWLPTFLIEQHGRSLVFSTTLTAAVLFINILGNLVGGALLERGAARWLLMTVACATMAVTGVLILASPAPDWLKYGMSLTFTGVGGMLPACVFSGVPVHARGPSAVGVTTGMVVQGSGIGNLAGPPAFAALIAWLGGWALSSGVLLLAGAAGVACALGLRAVERRR